MRTVQRRERRAPGASDCGLKLTTEALAGGFDDELATGAHHEAARVREHLIDLGVVVRRIVMEEEEFLHSGAHGQFHRIIDTAMTPADVSFVFLGIVLGVEDEHIHALDEADDLVILPLGVGDRLGSLKTGRAGDVVVWDGDPLELTSAPTHVLIDGIEQPLGNRQDRLRDRYRTPQEGALPKAYEH